MDAAAIVPGRFDPRLGRRRAVAGATLALLIAATLVGLAVLAVLLVHIARDAWPWLDAEFLTAFPSRKPERAGVLPALAGTVWTMLITAAVAVPVGVGAAVYLEEYAPGGRLRRVAEANIATLAGVPSVLYGLLGLLVFVRALGAGRSLLAGGLTLALLVLPVVIVATQEALRAVPGGIRESAYALGATRSQVVGHHLLPLALPTALTGVILALSRAIGETAPLIVVGAATFVAFLPASPLDPFSALPLQIYTWTARPQPDFQGLAAAAIVVLLAVLFALNGLAFWLRARLPRRP